MSQGAFNVGGMRFTIDCSTCLRNRSPACDDCVVMFITDRDPDEAIVVDAAEFAALRRLSAAGLIPDLAHGEVLSGDAAPIETAEDGEGAPVTRLRDVG